MELSALVKVNKMTVAELNNKMEQQRTSAEQKIIDMDAEIKRLERECVYINSIAKETGAQPTSQNKVEVTQAKVINVSNKQSAPIVPMQVSGGQTTKQLEQELSFAVSDNQEMIQEMKVIAFENESLKAHIQNLDTYIIDLKAHIDRYIPVRDDVADKLIAEKINTHRNKAVLKNKFKWES